MNQLKFAILLSVLMAMAGCNDQPPRYPVAGRVLIDGEPLSTGSIRFVPEQGRPATSMIHTDGTFALSQASLTSDPTQRGIMAGKYRVAVSAANVIDEDADDVEWLAPSKYADFRTSEIAMEIDRPHDDLVVDLTWKEEGSLEGLRNSKSDSSRSNAPSQQKDASAK
jgi:hypothetical protein